MIIGDDDDDDHDDTDDNKKVDERWTLDIYDLGFVEHSCSEGGLRVLYFTRFLQTSIFMTHSGSSP